MQTRLICSKQYDTLARTPAGRESTVGSTALPVSLQASVLKTRPSRNHTGLDTHRSLKPMASTGCSCQASWVGQSVAHRAVAVPLRFLAWRYDLRIYAKNGHRPQLLEHLPELFPRHVQIHLRPVSTGATLRGRPPFPGLRLPGRRRPRAAGLGRDSPGRLRTSDQFLLDGLDTLLNCPSRLHGLALGIARRPLRFIGNMRWRLLS